METSGTEVVWSSCATEQGGQDPCREGSNREAARKNGLAGAEGKVRVGWSGRVALTYKHYYVWNRQLNGALPCNTGSSAQGSVMTSRAGMGVGSGKEVQEGGDTCVHIADHFIVEQRLTQHCKTVIPRFKKKKKILAQLKFDYLWFSFKIYQAVWKITSYKNKQRKPWYSTELKK